ncbi:hypothetical protein GCM10009674_18250 [Nesterenkonia xinjiangensis]
MGLCCGSLSGRLALMRRPDPLPPSLYGRIFTRQQALAAGVPEKRLRARDIERVVRGIYRHRPVPGDADVAPAAGVGGPHGEGPHGEGPHVEGVPSETIDLALLQALCSRAPGLWLSHATAARVHGLPLPPRFAGDSAIHVSGRFRGRTVAGLGAVRQHGPIKNTMGEVLEQEGLRLASPERVFIDLMPHLRPDELVVLGDALVREPRAVFEGRGTPLEHA